MEYGWDEKSQKLVDEHFQTLEQLLKLTYLYIETRKDMPEFVQKRFDLLFKEFMTQ